MSQKESRFVIKLLLLMISDLRLGRHVSLKGLKTKIDSKMQRILGMLGGHSITPRERVELGYCVGVQTEDDTFHKDNESTFAATNRKYLDNLDLSEISDVSGQGKSFPSKSKDRKPSGLRNKVQTNVPPKYTSRNSIGGDTSWSQIDLSRITNKLDNQNTQFQSALKQRKVTGTLTRRARLEAIPVNIYESMKQQIEQRKQYKREEVPLKNFVRERLLKRVVELSQKPAANEGSTGRTPF